MLFLPLAVSFSTIEDGRWVKGLPPLLPLVALSMLVGRYVLRRGTSWKAAHAMVLGLGLVVALGLGFWLLSGFSVMAMGVILMVAAWGVGHITVWLAYRGFRPPLIVMPGLAILLVVLGFLPSDYYVRLLFYLLAASPAIAHFHFRRWRASGGWAPRLRLLTIGVVLMAASVGLVWPTPSPDQPIRPAFASEIEEPWYDFQETVSKFFRELPNRKRWPRFDLQSDLPFTGPGIYGVYQDPGEAAIFLVKSDEPHKWRLQVYEQYTPRGWTKQDPASDDGGLSNSVTLPWKVEVASREEVRIDVRTLAKMNLIASVGEPLHTDEPSLVEVSPTPRFSLDLIQRGTSRVPIEVRRLEQALYLWYEVWQMEEAPSDILSPASLRVADDQVLENGSLVLERMEGDLTLPLALRFPYKLTPPRSYVTVGSLSVALPDMLRQAGRDYPTWVTDRYLQLPAGFPVSVRRIAVEVAKAKDNPYDIAESIKNHLKSFPYSTEITPPPPGMDGVEYFLTVQRVGFCQYYASAMITMLRSLGIPARLVTGFSPGEWDEGRQAWVVKAKHYHAWPEVYFPGYGWVEFEPTPPTVQPSLGLLEAGNPEELTDQGLDFAGACESLPEEFREVACEEFEGFYTEDDLDLIEDGLDEQADSSGSLSGGSADSSGVLRWLLRGAAVVALMFSGVYLYLRRVTSRFGYSTTVYRSMGFLARIAGVPPRPQDTPIEFGSRLSAYLSHRRDIISQITWAYSSVRYGRTKGLGHDRFQGLKASWRSLRWSLLGLILRRLVPWPRKGWSRGSPRPEI